MAKTKISEFSSTPGNNTDIDGINIAEGCAPSGINDAIRELMSQLKDFQAGTAGDSFNGPVGTTTAAAGAFTTLSASSTVSGTGFSNYLASPPAIGGTAAAAGSFTTLTTSSTVTHNGGTANGVAYLNGSKVLTTGSDLAFDGTNFLKVFRTTGFYAWGSGYKGLITDRTSLVSASSSSVTTTHLASNLYFDDTVWRYSSATNAKGSSLTQNNGTLAFYATAAAGSSGNVATTTTLFSVDNTGRGTFADTVTLSGGTANGVAYLNGSKVLTTGSALTFDGSSLAVTLASTATPSLRLYYNGSSQYGQHLMNANGDYVVSSPAANGVTSGNLFLNGQTTYGGILFGLGGSEQMRLTSTGLGIGTSSPAYKLDVAGTSARLGGGGSYPLYLIADSGGLQLFNASGGATGDGVYLNGASHYLGFYTNSAEKMRLDSSGNLGIGTSSVTGAKLKVSAYSAGGAIMSEDASGSTSFVRILGDATSQNLINWQDGTALRFATSTQAYGTFNERMRLDSSGNLGIGTSSPQRKLHVNATPGATYGDVARFESNGSAGPVTLSFGDSGTSSALPTIGGNGNSLVFGTGAATQMTLNLAGNLGLGVTPSDGAKVLAIGNGTAPTTNISGGHLYVEGGALKYRGSSGTVTTIAAA